MSAIELRDIVLERDGRLLLDRVSLRVPSGGRMAIVGPSGSGKTSVLRVVAGLEHLRSGEVWIGSERVDEWSTGARDVAMVFQQAALQPHLDVRGNIGFPLRLRRHRGEEVDRRVLAEARAFSIEDLLDRFPSQLSAGGRQAAATAHALVRVPGIVLLDEPVANLDAHTRADTLRRLLELQAGSGATMMVTTNDPGVALTVGGDIAVLIEGRVRQVGPSQELYDRPADLAIAELLADLPYSTLDALVHRQGSVAVITAGDLSLRTTAPAVQGAIGPVVLGVRSQDIVLDEPAIARATVQHTEFTGPRVLAHLEFDDGQQVVAAVPPPGPQRGDRVPLRFGDSGVSVFDPDGRAVAHGV